MVKKLILILAIVALVASAGTIPTGTKYNVNLTSPSVVKGNALKAGQYKIVLGDAKITIITANGKDPVEVPAKIETVEKKFDDTVVSYSTADGKNTILEIRLGGTKTKLLFN